MVGYITSYESFATMEGPGIRFAAFLSGCNLRCAYCHNPDTWKQGKPYEADELVTMILRYKPYFRGGGGVTFSGGEPLMQAEFLCEVGAKLRAQGIHIALDTSCSFLGEPQKKLYRLCDLVIADLKFTTPELYKDYCKNDIFGTVMSTLRYLNQQNIPVWIRTVIVPGINDTPEDIDAYYSHIKEFTNVQRFELKPFHTMGFSKYEKLGIPNPLQGKEGLPQETLEMLKNHLNNLKKKR